jgi:hypothetical protein
MSMRDSAELPSAAADAISIGPGWPAIMRAVDNVVEHDTWPRTHRHWTLER